MPFNYLVISPQVLLLLQEKEKEKAACRAKQMNLEPGVALRDVVGFCYQEEIR